MIIIIIAIFIFLFLLSSAARTRLDSTRDVSPPGSASLYLTRSKWRLAACEGDETGAGFYDSRTCIKRHVADCQVRQDDVRHLLLHVDAF